MKRLLYFLIFVVIVGGGLGLFAYLKPDLAKRGLEETQTFLTSPQVKGFFWPKITEGQFTVVYQDDDIPQEYARAIMKIAQTTSDVVQEELNRTYFREVNIYVFVEKSGHSYFWDNGEDEVHLVFGSTNEMMPPGLGGTQNHIAQIARHLAQLIGQVNSSGTETLRPHDQATVALATYMEMKLILPRLWELERENAWPSPYNYIRGHDQTVYDILAAEPPLEMQAGRYWSKWDLFWFRLDRIGGPETVGKVLNQAAGPVGNADVDGLARAVENVTENEELLAILKEAASES